MDRLMGSLTSMPMALVVKKLAKATPEVWVLTPKMLKEFIER